MRKYLALLRLSWQNGFVYRADLLFWRARQMLSTLMSLTVWSVIFIGQDSAFNYDRSAMISYVFLAAIMQSAILATSLHGLAGKIYSGELTNQLLKPVNIFRYYLSEDIADKLKNVGFVLLETIALYIAFSPEIVLPSLSNGMLFIAWLLLGITLHFFISMIFASIGFWSPDAWGPKFLFFMIVDFSAGKLFPLDILPELLQKILQLTPFPFLAYYQTQLFLGRLESNEIAMQSAVLVGWCLALGLAMRYVWKRGLKDYSAVGR